MTTFVGIDVGDCRPRIPHRRRPVERGGGEVQFGTGPDGVIVGGLTRDEVHALATLDGTNTLPATFVAAGRARITAERWRELLGLLARLGILDVPARRELSTPQAHDVLVLAPPGGWCGIDRLVRSLELSGIRATAGEEGLTACSGTGRPALVVLAGLGTVDPRRGDEWLAQDVPHLPVIVDVGRTTVGPLVHGGTPTPCLWCLELHRTDRDAAWPVLTTQLHPAAGSVQEPDVADGLGPATLQLVAGCLGVYARHLLAGRLPPPGVALDIGSPWPRLDHRRWPVHPHCGRHGLPQASGLAQPVA